MKGIWEVTCEAIRKNIFQEEVSMERITVERDWEGIWEFIQEGTVDEANEERRKLISSHRPPFCDALVDGNSDRKLRVRIKRP